MSATLPTRSVRSFSVLVVDDNQDAAESLAVLLGLEGFCTHFCTDATCGLDRAAAEQFDAVLLDLGMAGLDGYALARQIRAGGASSDALLIAVTGYGQPSDIERSTNAGFDAHLVKPVNLNELQAHLARVAELRGGRRP